MRCSGAIAALLLLVLSGAAFGDSVTMLFASKQRAVYQIRIIDVGSGAKAATGSGFVVGANGTVATNYHVVSDALSHPGRYRIEALAPGGGTREVQVVAVDVVNDLALLAGAHPQVAPIALAARPPARGSTIFSMGYPYELGITVVPGTYNGIAENSRYHRIHFSGAVNPGMSGGPVVDGAGDVVGINVASAGNQISFLVPVDVLRALLARAPAVPPPQSVMRRRIRAQLMAEQARTIDSLLARPWPAAKLGDARVLGEIGRYVRCWGSSNIGEPRTLHLQAIATCRTEEDLHLGPSFTTGTIGYQFLWLESRGLNRWRFYALYRDTFANFIPDNDAGEDDVGNYACRHWFVDADHGDSSKVVFCARAYRDYPGLFDVLFLRGTIDGGHRALISHFTLAGVDRQRAMAFARKFMEKATWPQS